MEGKRMAKSWGVGKVGWHGGRHPLLNPRRRAAPAYCEEILPWACLLFIKFGTRGGHPTLTRPANPPSVVLAPLSSSWHFITFLFVCKVLVHWAMNPAFCKTLTLHIRCILFINIIIIITIKIITNHSRYLFTWGSNSLSAKYTSLSLSVLSVSSGLSPWRVWSYPSTCVFVASGFFSDLWFGST